MSAGYIGRQLRRFRAGERHNDPDGSMRSVAQKLSDAEIQAVAQYLDGG
jgi:cytochrome c553